mgnify:CR=1 FL=1
MYVAGSFVNFVFHERFPAGLKRQRNVTKIRPTLKKTHSALYFGNFRHENYASLLTSRLYTELSWIPSFDAWMLVTLDRERLFLLKLINLGRNKCLTIVNVIYSTLIGGIWHYVLEREHKSAIRPFYILNWFLKISLFKFVFFFSPNVFFPRDFWHKLIFERKEKRFKSFLVNLVY